MTEVIRGLTAEQCLFTKTVEKEVKGTSGRVTSLYVILNLNPNPNNTVFVTPISSLTLRTVKENVLER